MSPAMWSASSCTRWPITVANRPGTAPCAFVTSLACRVQQVRKNILHIVPLVRGIAGIQQLPEAEENGVHVTGYRRYMDEKVLDRLDKLLWEVENLFKETYADLAMLTLLGLRAEDYMAIADGEVVQDGSGHLQAVVATASARAKETFDAACFRKACCVFFYRI